MQTTFLHFYMDSKKISLTHSKRLNNRLVGITLLEFYKALYLIQRIADSNQWNY